MKPGDALERWGGLCLWSAILLSIAIPEATAQPTGAGALPNIVLIIADDQRWDDFGFMGHPVVQTPHLDRLAAESAVFPNGYVPSSLCRPSLATLITGLYPHQHGITGNDPPPGVDRTEMLRFIRQVPTLPRLLRPLGYASLQTGKWWEGHYTNGGFTHGMTTEGRHGGPGLTIGRETMQPIHDFIEAHQAEPFLLWYAPFLPHTPHNPPERLLAAYRREGRPEALAKYWAMIAWFDETVGALLDALDRQGLRDNTLVLFAVDNGWIQRTAPMEGWSFQFAPKSKRSPYDGGVRTPILVRWPGRVSPGVRETLASTVDIVPTVLAAAGLPALPTLPGLNLLALATGDATREAVYGEIFAHDVADLDRPAASLQYRWVREGPWKLIMPAEGTPELYHVEQDPNEEQPHTTAQAARVRTLQQRLDDWWQPDMP